jgi:hypothetical protein
VSLAALLQLCSLLLRPLLLVLYQLTLRHWCYWFAPASALLVVVLLMILVVLMLPVLMFLLALLLVL